MKEILKKAEKLGCKIPHKKWSDIDREVAPVLREMEKAGIKIDVSALKRLEKKLSIKVSGIEKKIYTLKQLPCDQKVFRKMKSVNAFQ